MSDVNELVTALQAELGPTYTVTARKPDTVNQITVGRDGRLTAFTWWGEESLDRIVDMADSVRAIL